MFTNQYIKFSICKESISTIEYVLKLLASIMETIIFIFMGISIVSDHYSWNTGFVIITLISCSLFRLIGVFIFAKIANRGRLIKLKLTDMLIMSYGGIRGAVAFALALILDESKIPRKKEFLTATIAVVFFTVFIQGSTIGPIVKYFKIKLKEEEEPSIPAKLGSAVIDNLMSSLETIAGFDGKHSFLHKIRYIDRKYINPFLQRKRVVARNERIFRQIEEILDEPDKRSVSKRKHSRIQLEKNVEKAPKKYQSVILHHDNPINIRNLIESNDKLGGKVRRNVSFDQASSRILDNKRAKSSETRQTRRRTTTEIQSPHIGVVIPPPWKSDQVNFGSLKILQ